MIYPFRRLARLRATADDAEAAVRALQDEEEVVVDTSASTWLSPREQAMLDTAQEAEDDATVERLWARADTLQAAELRSLSRALHAAEDKERAARQAWVRVEVRAREVALRVLRRQLPAAMEVRPRRDIRESEGQSLYFDVWLGDEYLGELRFSDHAQPPYGGYSVAREERWGASDWSLDPEQPNTRVVAAAIRAAVAENARGGR